MDIDQAYLYKKMVKHAQKAYLSDPEEQPKHHRSHQGQPRNQ
jgi:hypothetical protein